MMELTERRLTRTRKALKEQRIAVIIDETANRKKQCNPLKGSGVPFLQTLIFLNRCN
ncbi:hypothetical protein M595_2732 [Lyngbya aestuarii BL J]|uniref:Uncharacterized protein n=1 Tax=Lyngbya aestuarii BL J TaxID=1348334 RepID=U7QLJ9_9CYAN|nr:hypothetical protein M595_2732 [Lyngbya aestuarii BL J]